MKISIKATKIVLDGSTKDFVEKKIAGLEKYLRVSRSSDPRFSNNHLKAAVEIEKTTLHHKKGPFFRAECQIALPGQILRTEAKAEDVRKAVIEVQKEMKDGLKEYKNKIKEKRERGGRKRGMRTSPAA